MALEHGQGKAAKRLAERELLVYDPSFYKKPHVYERGRRYAVLVIDMLNDFVTGALKCDRMVPKVNHVVELVDAARGAGVPVIYCNDSHRPTDFELYRWKPHAMRGTRGAEVIKDLRPRNRSDNVVPKTSYSSFHDTDLGHVLSGLYDGKGVNTLLLTGLHTDCCVRHTAADAFFRRYELVVVEDGVESFTEAQHRVGLQYIRYWYLADVIGAKEAIRRIR